MITEQDLKEAIAECEGQRNPSSSTCMKLAAFYTIKDRLYPMPNSGPKQPDVEPVRYSRAAGPVLNGNVEYASDTEFGRAISGMDMAEFIPIMDELMSTLQVVSPRIYASVMRQLTDL